MLLKNFIINFYLIYFSASNRRRQLNNWRVTNLHVSNTSFGTAQLNKHGFITVKKSGVYYLYSQVTLFLMYLR